ncbi:MAG: hypothetical protein ACK4YV_15350, partial [Emticicia sp.]
QINATFFSALGEDDQKLLLARAIQMFVPGIPQVWYLDIFAGKNNYAAADAGGSAGHKEINRTTITLGEVKEGLKTDVVQKQLEIIRLRNTALAFSGQVQIDDSDATKIDIKWVNSDATAHLKADLTTLQFSIHHQENEVNRILNF